MVRLFASIICVAILVSQVSGAIIDFEKFIKSMQSSKSDSKFKYLSAHKDTPSYTIPRYAMDEFRTFIDRIETEKPMINIEDDNEFNNELKAELDEIRKAMSDEGQNRQTELKEGQQLPIQCGKYGCCKDNRPADSDGDEGCARRLCEDMFMKTCSRLTEEEKDKLCKFEYMKRKCPFTCSSCKFASPIKGCLRQYPAEMCCWDGTVARDLNGLGCKPCVDLYKPVCKIFSKVAGGCASNSWRIRSFMNKYCPETCGYCSKK